MAIRVGSGGLKFQVPNHGQISQSRSASAASAGGSASAAAYAANRRYAGLSRQLRHQAQQRFFDREHQAGAQLVAQRHRALLQDRDLAAGADRQRRDIEARQDLQADALRNRRRLQRRDIRAREAAQGRDIAARRELQANELIARQQRQEADVAARERFDRGDHLPGQDDRLVQRIGQGGGAPPVAPAIGGPAPSTDPLSPSVEQGGSLGLQPEDQARVLQEELSSLELDDDGKRERARILGNLRAVQANRSRMRPDAYGQAVQQAVDDYRSSVIGSPRKESASVAQKFDDQTVVQGGQRYQYNRQNGDFLPLGEPQAETSPREQFEFGQIARREEAINDFIQNRGTMLTAEGTPLFTPDQIAEDANRLFPDTAAVAQQTDPTANIQQRGTTLAGGATEVAPAQPTQQTDPTTGQQLSNDDFYNKFLAPLSVGDDGTVQTDPSRPGTQHTVRPFENPTGVPPSKPQEARQTWQGAVKQMPPDEREVANEFTPASEEEMDSAAGIVGQIRKRWDRKSRRWVLDPGDVEMAKARLADLKEKRSQLGAKEKAKIDAEEKEYKRQQAEMKQYVEAANLYRKNLLNAASEIAERHLKESPLDPIGEDGSTAVDLAKRTLEAIGMVEPTPPSSPSEIPLDEQGSGVASAIPIVAGQASQKDTDAPARPAEKKMDGARNTDRTPKKRPDSSTSFSEARKLTHDKTTLNELQQLESAYGSTDDEEARAAIESILSVYKHKARSVVALDDERKKQLLDAIRVLHGKGIDIQFKQPAQLKIPDEGFGEDPAWVYNY